MERFREETIKRLSRLCDSKRQIAFAYAACHRMLPNYKYFVQKNNWGNEFCLTEALDRIQDFLLKDCNDFDKNELLKVILRGVPSSSNFSGSSCTYAQNAASAIYYTLNNLFKVDVNELSLAPVLSRDTVYDYIQEFEPFNYEDTIENHWMMKRELQKQESDFDLLMAASVLDDDILKIITTFNWGKSNIEL